MEPQPQMKLTAAIVEGRGEDRPGGLGRESTAPGVH
jgi:hypothetical protein